jgi:hypothetical protein
VFVGSHETYLWLNLWVESFSSSFHFLLSLYIGLGVLLLCVLLELSFYIYNKDIYQVTFQSMHFHFYYIENTKNRHFALLGIFVF